jgi:hypothetical protein
MLIHSQIYHEQLLFDNEEVVNNGRFGESMCYENNILVFGSWWTKKVHVYERTVNGWTKVATLTRSDGANNSFGMDVDINNDVIIVGAPAGLGLQGAVYVFEKPASGWVNMTETAKLTSEVGFPNNEFGNDVAIHNNTIVTNGQDYINSSYHGVVFVFERPFDGWKDATQNAELVIPGNPSNSVLGSDLDVYDDIIAATGSIFDGNDAVYVFQRPVNGWNSSATPIAELRSLVHDDYFGGSMELHEKVLILGSESGRGKDARTGCAFIFEKPVDGWHSMTETAKLYASDGRGGDHFGMSVSMSGNVAIVGANRYYHDYHTCGYAFIFEKSENGWNNMTETAILYPSDLQPDDAFGYSVLATDSIFLAASPHSDVGSAFYCGTVYQFTNKFEPQDIVCSNTTMDECSSPGDTVCILSVIDGNRYDLHSIQLVPGDGLNDADNSSFILTDSVLFINATTDFEKKESYSIYMRVVDTTNLAFSKPVTISVNNNPPIIRDTTFYIPKSSINGTFVGQLDIKGDTNSITFEYYYDYWDGAFDLDSITGIIKVADNSILGSLIYSHFDLEVEASDGITDSDATVTVSTEIPLNDQSVNREELLRIYPNPANQYIIINKNNIPGNTFKIMDCNGNVVIESVFYNNDQIDISNLPQGVYLIQLNGHTQKFIKN